VLAPHPEVTVVTARGPFPGLVFHGSAAFMHIHFPSPKSFRRTSIPVKPSKARSATALSTKREPKHLGDAFGNKTVFFIISSETGRFAKTFAFCLFFIFPMFFFGCFLPHMYLGHLNHFSFAQNLIFPDMALGKNNIRFMPLNMPIRHGFESEACYSVSEVNIKHHGIVSHAR